MKTHIIIVASDRKEVAHRKTHSKKTPCIGFVSVVRIDRFVWSEKSGMIEADGGIHYNMPPAGTNMEEVMDWFRRWYAGFEHTARIVHTFESE